MINRIFNTEDCNPRMIISPEVMEELGISEGEEINGVDVYSTKEEIKPKVNPEFPIHRLHQAIKEEQESKDGLGIELLNPNDSGLEISDNSGINLSKESPFSKLMSDIRYYELLGLDPSRN